MLVRLHLCVPPLRMCVRILCYCLCQLRPYVSSTVTPNKHKTLSSWCRVYPMRSKEKQSTLCYYVGIQNNGCTTVVVLGPSCDNSFTTDATIWSQAVPHACTYACTRTRTHTHTHTCTHARTCKHTHRHARTRTCMHAHTCSMHTHTLYAYYSFLAKLRCTLFRVNPAAYKTRVPAAKVEHKNLPERLIHLPTIYMHMNAPLCVLNIATWYAQCLKHTYVRCILL